MDKNSNAKRDIEFLEAWLPLTDLLFDRYFRTTVEGSDSIPSGPVLIVANHNGIGGLEVMLLLTLWQRYMRKKQENIFVLTHDFSLRQPVLGDFLSKLGAIKAGHENARECFKRGDSVLVYPGGDYEAFRSFRNRDRIVFNGRKGYAKLAIDNQVPILPLINIGGHEQSLILWQDKILPRLLKLDKKYRIKALPVTPFNFALLPLLAGPMFQKASILSFFASSMFPLPAKITFEFLPTIELSEAEKKGLSDQEKVDRLDEKVRTRMQIALEKGYEKRDYPILG